jgi:hypothetical protein
MSSLEQSVEELDRAAKSGQKQPLTRSPVSLTQILYNLNDPLTLS